MNIIKYDTLVERIDYSLPTVFLAGPTVRGNQPHLRSWRIDAVEIFKSKNFKGNLILPEFPNVYESDQSRYDLPIWEFHCMRMSDVIMFWVPRTKELIGLTTNYEMGFWVADNRYKVVYGRPNDAYRIEYLDIMWVEHSKVYMHESTGDTVAIHTNLNATVDATLKNSRLYAKLDQTMNNIKKDINDGLAKTSMYYGRRI